MPTAVVQLADQVVERAKHDAEFAAVLDAILAAPTAPQGTLERVAAQHLNDQRRAALTREFVAGSLPTRAVQTLLGLGSPQAVHRLRTRGKLIGAAVGNQTWFPAWQFDGDRIWPVLPQVLTMLTRFTSDPMAADRVIRLSRDELGGLSIAEALRNPKIAEVASAMLTALDG